MFKTFTLLTLALTSQIAQPKSEPKNAEKPKFKLEASAPQFQKPDPNLDSYWEVKLQFKNESEEEIVLSPFIEIKVYNDNKPVKNDGYIGHGFIAEELMPFLEKKFLTIPSGKTGELLVNLGQNISPSGTIGWDFKKPGTYKVSLTYKYNKKAFTADYINDKYFFTDDALKKAKDTKRLWNRAVEAEQAVEVKLVVKE
jgi:hypothetical protein